jgi:hypothetical protein
VQRLLENSAKQTWASQTETQTRKSAAAWRRWLLPPTAQRRSKGSQEKVYTGFGLVASFFSISILGGGLFPNGAACFMRAGSPLGGVGLVPLACVCWKCRWAPAGKKGVIQKSKHQFQRVFSLLDQSESSACYVTFVEDAFAMPRPSNAQGSGAGRALAKRNRGPNRDLHGNKFSFFQVQFGPSGPLGSVAGDPDDRHRGWLLCPSSVPAAHRLLPAGG